MLGKILATDIDGMSGSGSTEGCRRLTGLIPRRLFSGSSKVSDGPIEHGDLGSKPADQGVLFTHQRSGKAGDWLDMEDSRESIGSGAKEGEDKHGGAHVFIGEGGHIEKGPKELVGKQKKILVNPVNPRQQMLTNGKRNTIISSVTKTKPLRRKKK